MGMGLCAALPAAVLAVGGADAPQFDLRLAAALYREAHDRYLPRGSPIECAGLARTAYQEIAWPRHDRDGRAIRDFVARRVCHLLWPVLSDHDGFTVQPVGPAPRPVPSCRASADGLFRSHAGRPPGQPDDY